MLILDCEVYKNYFLASFLSRNDRVENIELYDNHPLDKERLASRMLNNTTLTFNGNSYDLYMVAAAIKGWTTHQIKTLSDAIITSNEPHWRVAASARINYPADWDSVDIIDVLPGRSSLKIYGARMGFPKLQELPIDPSASIDAKDRDILRQYCENDLRVTQALAKKLTPQINLRRTMGEQYGMDLRSKSDAQIAEVVLKAEIEKVGDRLRPLKINENLQVRYLDPGFLKFDDPFDDPTLSETFNKILKHPFELSDNGSVKIPPWLRETKIGIALGTYQMGIGGLHSTEKCQTVVPSKHETLCEFDVTSYYPNIILRQKTEPANAVGRFLPVYKSLVNKRIEAKKCGDTATADSMKIVINASFGKFGSKYSVLYSPELLIQTTLTGQLSLLMLIERFETVGARVVSANTDGVVVLFNKALANDVEQVVVNWEIDTSFDLERTDYRAIHSRDVNNYIAVKHDGTTKGKGSFADPGLSKNPDFSIISEAIASQLSGRKMAHDVINQCQDVRKFVTIRRVSGGAIWRGKNLGQSVRFYYSTEVDPSEHIEYAKNGNKVPKSSGTKPAMNLPDTLPPDVNKPHYIQLAQIAMKSMGI
tara:strand:- start:8019 stop:9797 length:1779 start_codon:yes stop_codon:yes gene_type:complete